MRAFWRGRARAAAAGRERRGSQQAERHGATGCTPDRERVSSAEAELSRLQRYFWDNVAIFGISEAEAEKVSRLFACRMVHFFAADQRRLVLAYRGVAD